AGVAGSARSWPVRDRFHRRFPATAGSQPAHRWRHRRPVARPGRRRRRVRLERYGRHEARTTGHGRAIRRPTDTRTGTGGDMAGGGPLIVQSDRTLLLEVDHPDADECRTAIAPFAELERSPEHVHTYRLTPLGLWNARAAGHDAEQVVDALLRYSRYPVPHALLVDVAETMDRYGRLQLVNDPAHGLVLRGLDRAVLAEVVRSKRLAGMLGARIDED